jgi:hypothetical protein
VQIAHLAQDAESWPSDDVPTVGRIEGIAFFFGATDAPTLVSVDQVEFPRSECDLVPAAESYDACVPQSVAGVGIAVNESDSECGADLGELVEQLRATPRQPLEHGLECLGRAI